MIRFQEPCIPPRWARGGHAQTLLGHYARTPGEPLTVGQPGVTRRDLALEDGDVIVLMEAEPLAPGPLTGTTVHLFHGLTGSSDSNYVRLSAGVLRRAGARIVAFNHRGQGPGEGLARGTYHSGSAPDLWAAIADARDRAPGHLHIAVGFSLSGNCLLLGAGRDGSLRGTPDALLAVNPPVDLAAAVRRIESGVNRLYDQNFVRGIRHALRTRRKRGLLDGPEAEGIHVPFGASVRIADDRATAPLAGFPSGDAYYTACSSAPWIRGVDIPAVILTSDDDPFICADTLAHWTDGSRVFLHVEPHGGHLGYLSAGAPPADDSPGSTAKGRWLGRAVLHYVSALATTSTGL